MVLKKNLSPGFGRTSGGAYMVSLWLVRFVNDPATSITPRINLRL
jgi:hypothetical protein